MTQNSVPQVYPDMAPCVSRRLAVLRAVNSLKTARAWLGFSLLEMTTHLKTSRGALGNWEHGRREMPAAKLEQLGHILINCLAKSIGRDDIGLKIEANSPFMIIVYARCSVCHQWFELKHARYRRCERCRGKR
jgi:hypothetical protein